MSMLVSFVLSFFPRDVLDEILNLIGSVSEGFPSYSLVYKFDYSFVEDRFEKLKCLLLKVRNHAKYLKKKSRSHRFAFL